MRLVGDGSRLSIQLSVITAFQILLSFGVQWYVVTRYGAGFQTDALYAGWAVPQVVVTVLIDTVSVVLIPALSKCREDEVHSHGWMLFLIMGMGFLGISTILFLLMPVIIPFIVPGFSPAAKQLTVSLSRIQIFGLAGTGCYAILSALYQVRSKFIWPPLSILLAAGANWGFVFWALPRLGIAAAAWGQVLFSTLPALLLLPALGRLRIRQWKIATFKRGWQQIRPIMLLKAYSMTSMPFDRFLASFLVPGSVVTYELVWRFYSSVIRVLSQGILMPFFPRLSRMAHAESWREFMVVYRRQSRIMLGAGLLIVGGVSAAAVTGLVVIPATPVRSIVGSLTSEDLSRIWIVMICMSGMLPFIGLSNSQVNAFYATGDTRTPARIGIVVYTIGILFRIAGFLAGGLKGMAIAVTCWTGLYCLVLEFVLREHWARRSHLEERVATPGETAVQPITLSNVS